MRIFVGATGAEWKCGFPPIAIGIGDERLQEYGFATGKLHTRMEHTTY